MLIARCRQQVWSRQTSNASSPLPPPSGPFRSLHAPHYPFPSPLVLSSPSKVENTRFHAIKKNALRTDGRTDGSTDGSTDGPTDGPTDGRTDGRTDRPSYRDARTHLKTTVNTDMGSRQSNLNSRLFHNRYTSQLL